MIAPVTAPVPTTFKIALPVLDSVSVKPPPKVIVSATPDVPELRVTSPAPAVEITVVPATTLIRPPTFTVISSSSVFSSDWINRSPLSVIKSAFAAILAPSTLTIKVPVMSSPSVKVISPLVLPESKSILVKVILLFPGAGWPSPTLVAITLPAAESVIVPLSPAKTIVVSKVATTLAPVIM